ncbi:MAG: HAD-IA family hydrolase [Myxococcota bacterium]
MSDVPVYSVAQVLDRFDGVLLDSYGVLVDGRGALPGAAALLARLEATGTPWMVVSNDASRSVQASAERYAGLGLPIAPTQILLSAAMLAPHFAAERLSGANTIVLGPPDSVRWAEDAGAAPVPWDDPEPDAVVVCDDEGYPFVEAVQAVITTLARRLRHGHTPALVLPNPDLVYPTGSGGLALTAGTAALVIERALWAVFGDAAPRFVPLGKPEPAIFLEACRRIGVEGRAVVMLGDQLATDVAGGNAAGLSTGLLGTGVAAPRIDGWPVRPDFVLPSLV